tara:strand:+ start:1487 stop:1900 length:414 start_codon:yes stop_codon:yes gene_type:complete
MRYEMSELNTALNPFNSLFNFGLEKNLERLWKPNVDIHEEDESWQLSVDLPGIPKEQIKVDVLDGQLVISGERESKTEVKGYSERRYGRFERRFNLPERIEASKIKANYAHGVLNLTIPKEEKAKPVSINIDVAEIQ